MSTQSQYVMTQRVNLCSPVSTLSANDQVQSPPCSAVKFYPKSTSPPQQQLVNNENTMWNFTSRQPMSNNPNNLRPLTLAEKLNFISELTKNMPYSMRILALQLSQMEQQNAAAEHSKITASHPIPSAQEAENRYWSFQQHQAAAVTTTGSELPALVSLRSSNTSKPSAQSSYGLWQNPSNCQPQQHSVMQPQRTSTSRLGSCSSTHSDYSSNSSDRSSGAGSPGLTVYNFDPPLLF
jgi:hypothetical protein